MEINKGRKRIYGSAICGCTQIQYMNQDFNIEMVNFIASVSRLALNSGNQTANTKSKSGTQICQEFDYRTMPF
jgi:hypothetical protein